MTTSKSLLFALLLFSATAQAGSNVGAPATPDANLVGVWKSATAQDGALEGSLVLNKDRTLLLQAKDQPEYTGTWAVSKPGVLKLEIPEAGASEMAFRRKGATLTLTYDNGNTQVFTRALPLKGAKK
jgi:hypothetical protein